MLFYLTLDVATCQYTHSFDMCPQRTREIMNAPSIKSKGRKFVEQTLLLTQQWKESYANPL